MKLNVKAFALAFALVWGIKKDPYLRACIISTEIS